MRGISLLCSCMLFTASLLVPATPAGAQSQPPEIAPSATRASDQPARLISTASVPQARSAGQQKVQPKPVLPSAPGGSPATPRGRAVSVPAPSQITPSTSSGTTFVGQSDTGVEPADPQAAAGPQHVVETVNEQFAIYDRAGNQLYTTTFQNWFNQQVDLKDPQVIYDPWGGRFIFIVDANGNGVWLSISQTSSAIGNSCTWLYAGYNIGANNYTDRPRIGVDNQGIYWGYNVLELGSNTFIKSELWAASRSSLESCSGSPTANIWDNLTRPDGSPADSPQPTVAYSTAAFQYILSSYGGGGCSLTLWKMTGVTLLSSAQAVPSQCYAPANPAAQQGSSETIAVGGTDLAQATLSPQGTIDATLTCNNDWGGGNVNAVVCWFKVDPSAGAMRTQGSFGTAGIWWYYSAMQEDAAGNAIFVADISSPSHYLSVWYVSLSPDNVLSSTTLALASGAAADADGDNPERWGDFSSAMLDPTDHTKIWICSSYVDAASHWGTWIGQAGA